MITWKGENRKEKKKRKFNPDSTTSSIEHQSHAWGEYLASGSGAQEFSANRWSGVDLVVRLKYNPYLW